MKGEMHLAKVGRKGTQDIEARKYIPIMLYLWVSKTVAHTVSLFWLQCSLGIGAYDVFACII